MNCPNCQTLNHEGAKFCFNCGAQLSIACRNCGTRLAARAKFCHNCGQAVAATDDRRQTTDQQPVASSHPLVDPGPEASPIVSLLFSDGEGPTPTYEEAYRAAQDTLRAAEEAGDLERRVQVLSETIVFYHISKGEFDAAWKAAEEAYELSLSLGLAIPPVVAAYGMATIAQMRGEYEKAIEWNERGIEAARPIESIHPFLLAMPLGALGSVYTEVSERLADRAQIYHKELLEVLSTPSGAPAGGVGWTDLGFTALTLGEIECAQDYFSNALTLPSMHIHLQKPRVLVGAALVAIAQRRIDDAAKHVEEATRYAEERQMRNMYPLVYYARGEISIARGDYADAYGWYTLAEQEAALMDMRPALWQAQSGAAHALDAMGRHDEATKKRTQATDTIGSISALFKDQSLCSLFTDNALKRLTARTVIAMR